MSVWGSTMLRSPVVRLATALSVGVGVVAAGPAAAGNARGPDRIGASDLRAVEFSAQARRVRPRIEIYPSRPLYRQCVDGYRQVWRPYWGTYVVTPYQRCWWVRG